MISKHTIEYSHGPLEALPEGDRELVAAALGTAREARAPMSGFHVGAAARLSSGAIVTGGNEESAIGALSLCAERKLLYKLTADDTVEAMAIVSATSERECYPCGVCRQQMAEFEQRQEAPMRVIMAGRDTATTVESAKLLLPFTYIY